MLHNYLYSCVLVFQWNDGSSFMFENKLHHHATNNSSDLVPIYGWNIIFLILFIFQPIHHHHNHQ